VTVTGANGAIVTIPMASATNAAAAQAALNQISQMVAASQLTQVNFSSLPLPGGGPSGVVTGGAANLGTLPAHYLSAVSNASGAVTVVGNQNANDTIVSGQGGLWFTNEGQNTHVFVGGGTNVLAEGADSVSGVFGIDGIAAIDASHGASTINVNDG